MPRTRMFRRRDTSVKLDKAGKDADIWKALSDLVQRSRRRLPVINIDRLNRVTSSGETVAIPGKVLGAGNIDHPLKVAALSFSLSAAKAIEAAGGEVLSLSELAKRNPDGKGVRIIA